MGTPLTVFEDPMPSWITGLDLPDEGFVLSGGDATSWSTFRVDLESGAYVLEVGGPKKRKRQGVVQMGERALVRTKLRGLIEVPVGSYGDQTMVGDETLGLRLDGVTYGVSANYSSLQGELVSVIRKLEKFVIDGKKPTRK